MAKRILAQLRPRATRYTIIRCQNRPSQAACTCPQAGASGRSACSIHWQPASCHSHGHKAGRHADRQSDLPTGPTLEKHKFTYDGLYLMVTASQPMLGKRHCWHPHPISPFQPPRSPLLPAPRPHRAVHTLSSRLQEHPTPLLLEPVQPKGGTRGSCSPCCMPLGDTRSERTFSEHTLCTCLPRQSTQTAQAGETEVHCIVMNTGHSCPFNVSQPSSRTSKLQQP